MNPLTDGSAAVHSPYFWASAFVFSILLSLMVLVIVTAVKDARRANRNTH